MIDRISPLPDEILLSFLSLLTVKEAAKTSLLSQRWKYVWRYSPTLRFDDVPAMYRTFHNYELLGHERSTFVRWVDRVIENHIGLVIDELRVSFNLDDSCKSLIDKWLRVAMTKQVKMLELDFTSIVFEPDVEHIKYVWSLECPMLLEPPCTLASTKPSLTSLCLNNVNVSAEVMECLLLSYPSLENLCVVGSDHLTSLRSSVPSLQLEHLDVSLCMDLEEIDISAPRLLSLTITHPTELRIRNASLFSKASTYIGSFHSLSKYYSQLEHLDVRIFLGREEHLNRRLSEFPYLPNLKFLNLLAISCCDETLLEWTSFIEASPVLQKLTLKLHGPDSPYPRQIDKRDGRPLKCLKTLELIGFLGQPIDLELTNYVLDNAIMLQEVIVDFRRITPCGKAAEECVTELERKLPRGVKLIIKRKALVM